MLHPYGNDHATPPFTPTTPCNLYSSLHACDTPFFLSRRNYKKNLKKSCTHHSIFKIARTPHARTRTHSHAPAHTHCSLESAKWVSPEPALEPHLTYTSSLWSLPLLFNFGITAIISLPPPPLLSLSLAFPPTLSLIRALFFVC